VKYDYLDKINICFIIGPARSGTTLLSLILHNHNQCIAAPEIKHFLYFYRKYNSISYVSKELQNDIRQFYNLLIIDTKNLIFNIDQEIKPIELNIGEKITYAQLIKLIYLSFYSKNKNIGNVTCIIDKNPYYAFQVDKIIHVFPEANFICINRDYRANVLSNRQSIKSHLKLRSIAYYSTIWKLYSAQLRDTIIKHPKKSLRITYENLVLDKDNEVKRVMDFVNLPFDSKVFNFHENLLNKLNKLNLTGKEYERVIKKVTDLSRPINKDRLYSWKEQLQEDEIKQIEFICSSVGDFFNYHSIKKLSLIERIKFSIQSIPGYVRVKLFFLIDSYYLYLILNDYREIKIRKKHKLDTSNTKPN
jgi:hypothetical protein